MRKLLAEFKGFAFKGNVIDLAVGVMIGGAFGAIVTSLVNDMFMPLLSLLVGRIDFSNLSIALGTGDTDAVIRYGAFIQAVINFLLIAVCIFAFIKLVNGFRHEEAAPPPGPKCPHCLEPIHDGATRCPHCTSIIDAP